MNELEGGCLCGKIRYITSTKPFAAEYCHCRMCQKQAGAPVASWMDFKLEQVKWLTEKPVEYSSSEFVKRGFCPDCGSSLTFSDKRHSGYFTLTITSLDFPDLVEPTYHIFTESQVKWLKIDDGCKRHLKGKGE